MPRSREDQKPNRGRTAGPANRQALVTAAREIFAEVGYAAPLSAVARRAGVGQGSLYRHFPDRVALAVAVFEENLAELEALADGPAPTLAGLLDLIAGQAVAATAIIELLTTERHDPRVAPLGGRLRRLVATVLAHEQRAGRIAGHLTAEDVQLAITMLATVLARTDASAREAVAIRARALFDAAFTSEGGAPR